MTGRDRLEIGTYGDINTLHTAAGTVRAEARYRDWDGEVRKVTATAPTVKAAKQVLRNKLSGRSRATGFGTTLTPDSTVTDLADAWLEDVQIRPDLAAGTKDLYRRELISLVLPSFSKLRLREVTTGRVDHFLKKQAVVSYAHARHSRTVLSLMFNFALRHDAVQYNPVAGAERLKQPRKNVKALTLDQLDQVRAAAATWRTGKGVHGPKPDGRVRDLIEVLLGTSDRIGEALALRKRDIDDTGREQGRPMRVTVAGTLVVITGKGVYRQAIPKTDKSNRTLEVPEFTAEVIRRRLALIEGRDDEHLLFFTRKGTPLAPHNVRRTLRQMIRDANVPLNVSPHSFRRTGGTFIARATDSQTAADALGNTREIAERHYIEDNEAVPNPSPAIHLQVLAPRTAQQRTPKGDAA
jgi:integrase